MAKFQVSFTVVFYRMLTVTGISGLRERKTQSI